MESYRQVGKPSQRRLEVGRAGDDRPLIRLCPCLLRGGPTLHLEDDMSEEAKRQAREALRWWLPRTPLGVEKLDSDDLDKLSTAGLLVTPLHKRALAACRALSKNTDEMGYAYLVNEYADACRHVGREALAAERAKAEGPFCAGVLCHGNMGVFRRGLPYVSNPLSHAEANAVAAALNEVWRKEQSHA